MKNSFAIFTIFIGVFTLEVAARAYYDAVVVESRGADDGASIEELPSAFNPDTDCLLPKDPGPCRGFFREVYYSAETRRCENFVYSGCGGNRNRFKTVEDCERMCKGAGTKKSSGKPEDCIPFGESCEARGCRTAPKSTSVDASSIGCKPCLCPPVTEATQAVCQQPPAARGHCRALLPRWSYDQSTKSCREFQFGGCDGNGNNFASKESCLRLCSGV